MFCEVYDIVLRKELGCKGFVTTVDVTYARRCSSETNKLRYVHSIGGTSRDIAVEERGINYIKIRIVPFIINFDEVRSRQNLIMQIIFSDPLGSVNSFAVVPNI